MKQVCIIKKWQVGSDVQDIYMVCDSKETAKAHLKTLNKIAAKRQGFQVSDLHLNDGDISLSISLANGVIEMYRVDAYPVATGYAIGISEPLSSAGDHLYDARMIIERTLAGIEYELEQMSDREQASTLGRHLNENLQSLCDIDLGDLKHYEGIISEIRQDC